MLSDHHANGLIEVRFEGLDAARVAVEDSGVAGR